MKYSAVGFCIYCGSKNYDPKDLNKKLGDEHIIPFSLNGNITLPESSCRKCEIEINKYENVVNRKIFGDFRNKYNVRTRNKKDRKSHLEIGVIHEGGHTKIKKIPVKEFPTATVLYKFKECDFLKGHNEISAKFNWVPVIISSKNDLDYAVKKHKWDGIVKFKAVPFQLARLIAKISYSYLVAELGIDNFSPFGQVKDIILNRSNNVSYLVGGDWDIPQNGTDGDHLLQLRAMVQNKKLILIVEVRLFHQAGTPLYRTVVGFVDMLNKVHMDAFENKLKTTAHVLQNPDGSVVRDYEPVVLQSHSII